MKRHIDKKRILITFCYLIFQIGFTFPYKLINWQALDPSNCSEFAAWFISCVLALITSLICLYAIFEWTSVKSFFKEVAKFYYHNGEDKTDATT